MFDMRAYVASLAAVFLALGIGILLGTIIVDKGAVTRQQSALLKSIESQVSSVSEDNKLLKKELEISNKFQKNVIPHVIQGRLAERSIAVIHSGNLKGDVLRSIEQTIDIASGNVTGILLKEQAFLYSAENVEKIRSLSTESADVKDSKIEIVPNTVAKAISTSKPNLSELKRLGLISYSGAVPQMFSAVLVLLDQEKDMAVLDKFYKPFVESIKQYGLSIVIAEVIGQNPGLVQKMQGGGLMTVDNIDTAPGQIAMVLGLTGITGNFGAKEGADNLIPGTESDDSQQ